MSIIKIVISKNIITILKQQGMKMITRVPMRIAHIVVIILLSVASLTMGITLFIQGRSYSDLALISELNISLYLLIYGITMPLIGIVAIYAAYKKIAIILHIYEIFCLISFLLFGIFFAIVLFSKATPSSSNCFEPSNFFQFQMLEVSTQASSLYCTSNCQCLSKNSKVQDCSQWQFHPFQEVFAQMEQLLKCSGWCQINTNSYYVFNEKNGIDMPLESERITCYNAWSRWLGGKKLVIDGCFAAELGLLFLAVMFTNLRILDIGDQGFFD